MNLVLFYRFLQKNDNSLERVEVTGTIAESFTVLRERRLVKDTTFLANFMSKFLN